MRFHFSSSCKKFLKPLDNAKQESAFFLMVFDAKQCKRVDIFPKLCKFSSLSTLHRLTKDDIDNLEIWTKWSRINVIPSYKMEKKTRLDIGRVASCTRQTSSGIVIDAK